MATETKTMRGFLLHGLRRCREDAGLSLRELSDATASVRGEKRVYRSTIWDAENLRRGVQPRTARVLAKALGVSVRDLRGQPND